jgi:KDO2-lipid IV(A) lauroyltransferase
MASKFQEIVNGRFGIAFALGLARTLPPVLGYRVAFFLANRIANRRSLDMVQAVRANQWVVHGQRPSAAELDDIVSAAFRHTARCLYDLYHNLHNLPKMQELIDFGPRFEELVEQINSRERGMVIVGPHLSGFDFVGQASAMKGMKAIVITFARPSEGYKWQNDIRQYAGLEIAPASMGVMKEAVKRLKGGETVLTGVDRPVPDPRYRPNFFGLPSSLPVHHIMLALRAKVPVLVAAVVMRPDHIYEIVVSDFIEMEQYGDRDKDILCNAERVLEVTADLIRGVPEQWTMTYPVWPEITPPA